MSTKIVKILAIDGGGIRGVIPALILSEIEQRTQKPISELFDLIAGTSTGGILTLGLSAPDASGRKPRYRAADLAELYVREGREIFFEPRLFRIAGILDDLFEETYSFKGIERLMKQYFGETELKDALVNTLVTSYDLEQRATFIFKSRLARERPDAENFLMRDVARSTSAAPTYFEPKLVKRGDGRMALVDGGVFANNPAALAYAEAKEIYDTDGFSTRGITFKDLADEGVPPREIVEPFYLLSLGTGTSQKPIKYEKAKGWGLVNWVRPIIDIMMQGSSDSVHYQMRQLLPPHIDGTDRYTRLNVENIAKEHISMDNAKPENLEALQGYAREFINKQTRRIDEVCRILTS